MALLQTWRWFGSNDPVNLSYARQAGVEGVVTALHHIKCGELWTQEEIKKQQKLVADAGMFWSVVESVPIHEQIKTGGPDRDIYIERYKESLHNLAACGIKTVCYNFMPVLDWTRTDINYVVEDGSKALRFDYLDFVLFDVFLLKRKAAEQEHGSEVVQKAKKRLDTYSEEKIKTIEKTVLMGLPGTVDDLSLEEFSDMLKAYDHIDRQKLQENYAYFLKSIIPVAEEAGVKMTVHPDDPPRNIFGLPRIVSNEEDLKWVTSVIDSPSNGLCFCTGSLSARADNDLPGIVRRLGHKINFVHLRSVEREADGSFYEANHLEGHANMFNVMKELVVLQKNRGKERIPFRPDHGHQMLDDLNTTKPYPGYSAIGRLRGLAELRGLELGIQKMME